MVVAPKHPLYKTGCSEFEVCPLRMESFLFCSYAAIIWMCTPHSGCNRHHQDDYIYLLGNPEIDLQFATVTGWEDVGR